MNHPIHIPDLFRDLERRGREAGGVFWTSADELCVLDPQAAQEFNRLNFASSTLSDRLVDLLRRRSSPTVTWKELRGAWLEQLRRATAGPTVERLAARMARHCEATLGEVGDLGEWAQELCGRSLMPLVIDGLSTVELQRMHDDRRLKTQQLLALPGSPKVGFWRPLRSQLRVGKILRRQLRGRATGRQPRQLDLTDALVDALPRLGMDRAVDALGSVLTAIAGPPGAAATCLLYELSRRPGWRRRLASELAPLTPQQLAKSPSRQAPLCHRFVKESLRLWSLPTLMVRPVLVEMSLHGERLRVGQRVLLSPFLMHRDAGRWSQASSYDPDRWLSPESASASACPMHAASSDEPGAPTGKDAPPPYVPFGWAPRSCLGAGLAMLQLMLLCRLVLVCYRIVLKQPDAMRLELGTVPRVLGFAGAVEHRVGSQRT